MIRRMELFIDKYVVANNKLTLQALYDIQNFNGNRFFSSEEQKSRFASEVIEEALQNCQMVLPE